MENQQNFQKQYVEELEIDLTDYIRIVWRRKKSISAIFVLAVVVAAILSFALPKIYESSALIEVGKFGGNYLETQTEISSFLAQPSTLQDLVQRLGLVESKWPILKDAIKTKAVGQYIQISAQANNPQLAKKIVETVIDLLKERHQKMLTEKQKKLQFLEIEIQATENRIAEMEKELTRLKSPKTEAEALLVQGYLTALSYEREYLLNLKKERVNYSQTEIRLPAFEPTEPIKPNKKRNIAFGAILGLFIALGYAFTAEYWQKNKAKFIA